MTSQVQSGDFERGGVLPVFTQDGSDAFEAVTRHVETGVGVLLVLGESDVGKSTVLRSTASAQIDGRSSGVAMVDLSLAASRAEVLAKCRAHVRFCVDHLDRVGFGEGPFREAYWFIESALPNLLAEGRCCVVSVDALWANRFRSAYGIGVLDSVAQASPTAPVDHITLRPYRESEFRDLCSAMNIVPDLLDDAVFRRPGVLALVGRIGVGSPMHSANRVRSILLSRWTEGSDSDRERAARWGIARVLGRKCLESDRPAASRAEIYAEIDGRAPLQLVGLQNGPGLVWRGDVVEPESPRWSDALAAQELERVIAAHSSTTLASPVRASVVEAVVAAMDGDAPFGYAVKACLARLRDRGCSEIGYTGVVLSTLAAAGCYPDEEVVLRDLCLQGPAHDEVPRLDSGLVAEVQGILTSVLASRSQDLIEAMNALPDGYRSAVRGDATVWSTARLWSRQTPLRASVEQLMLELLPNGSPWRYEDLLDVAITGASTSFLQDVRETLVPILRGPAGTNELLADIWDGLNDGAWDQITVDATVGGLGFVAGHTGGESVRRVTAERCGLQRANLGSTDVSGWIMRDCDLFLADMRSCANVELADLSGSNWWSAILPPPARYALSDTCTDERFAEWASDPPWRNPYYEQPWPRPFGVLT